MPWWGWLLIGSFLMGAELFGVDAAFYLIFVGVAAIVMGLLGLAGVVLPAWGQWLLFSALALASMVLFRGKLYKRFRGVVPGYRNTLEGEVVEVTSDVVPGGQTRVSLRGSMWTVVNIGATTIAAGDSAEVVEATGTTLKISNFEQ